MTLNPYVPTVFYQCESGFWFCFTPGSNWASVDKSKQAAIARWEIEHEVQDKIPEPRFRPPDRFPAEQVTRWV